MAETPASPKLLSGDNPQIAKGEGDAPVQAYVAAVPGWKQGVVRRLDALIVQDVGLARLIRAEVVTVRRSDYVEAAFGSGGTFGAVLWRHVLPNSLTAVLGFAAIQSGWAILQIATLGFLGYGAPPPTPEWGLMIAEGRNYMATAWWLTLFPGLAVVAVVLAVNALGRAVLRAEP